LVLSPVVKRLLFNRLADEEDLSDKRPAGGLKIRMEQVFSRQAVLAKGLSSPAIAVLSLAF